MICVFVQFRCQPGRTYQVASAIYDREVVSELYSTSGEIGGKGITACPSAGAGLVGRACGEVNLASGAPRRHIGISRGGPPCRHAPRSSTTSPS